MHYNFIIKMKSNFKIANREGNETPNTHIVVGHYGSGKTEFAVNYALQKRKTGCEVALADLDIVNPYFRARQEADMLEERGIHVVSSSLGNDWRQALPALSGELQSFFVESGRVNVVDVGGDAVGARVLARFGDAIAGCAHDLWLVVNANRYETQTARQAAAFAADIMNTCGLRFTGVINNTHMLRETEMEDILRGSRVVQEACSLLNVPCVYTVCPEHLLEPCREARGHIPGELFPIKLYMRPSYL